MDLEFPKIEVRYQNLKVEAFVHLGSRALPTITNFVSNMAEVGWIELDFIDQFFALVLSIWLVLHYDFDVVLSSKTLIMNFPF